MANYQLFSTFAQLICYLADSMDYILTSKYQPTGDQPEAIRQLTDGLERGDQAQVLLGVTGSGKTFTVANVIANVNKPTLILSHNKTLAAQLYEEMKGFFPQNAVEYYVSYYDYYQPEAYLPTTDVYIESTTGAILVKCSLGCINDTLVACQSCVGIRAEHQYFVSPHFYFGTLFSCYRTKIRIHTFCHEFLRNTVLFVSFL